MLGSLGNHLFAALDDGSVTVLDANKATVESTIKTLTPYAFMTSFVCLDENHCLFGYSNGRPVSDGKATSRWCRAQE